MAEQGAPQSWEPLGAGSPSELGTPQSPSEQHQLQGVGWGQQHLPAGHLLFSQKGGSLLQLRSHWQVRVSLPTMS